MDQPIVNAARKYVDGLELARVDDENITIAAGAARDSSNTNDITLAAAVTVNALVVGANGIDTGALANNTLYAVYVIGDSTKYQDAAGLLSASASGPAAMPAGYDMYRRVGYVRTDGTADLLEFHQYGVDESRVMYYDAPISILAAGNAIADAEIDLSTFVPAARAVLMLDVDLTAANAVDLVELKPFGSAAANGLVRFGCGVAAQQVGSLSIPSALDAGVPKILYKVTDAGDAVTLLCAGYEDFLA